MTGKKISVIIPLFLFSIFAVPKAYPDNHEDTITKKTNNISSQYGKGHKWYMGDISHRVPYRHIVAPTVVPDSADVAYHEKKNFWRAGAEVFGLNMGVWAFDRYVTKGHYAYISWHTIKENFKHGFEWDNDHLKTNMFFHPYNGALYYNAGRANGYNFWQSELFAIGGSAMWEMFMECEYPSTNDIIATPIGGAALGEVFYRASDLVLNDRASGGERFGREFAALIIDPMRGLNRIVTGQAWKKRATSGRRFGTPPISVEASIGARMLTMIDNKGFRFGPVAEFNIEYGDRFEETTKIPYDYFSFLVELQAIKTQPLLSRIEIMGRLMSKEIIEKKNLNLNFGLYQHFDFFDSDTIRSEMKNEIIPETVPYKLGTPASIGGGAMMRYVPNKKMSFDGFAYLNLVVLAGISTDFYRDYHRNYSWGSGISLKGGLNWATADDKFSVKIANQFYWLCTKNNFDSDHIWMLKPDGIAVELLGGDNGITTFNHLEANVNYKLIKNLYLTGGLDFYTRNTKYKDLAVKIKQPGLICEVYYYVMTSRQLGAHLMITYKF
ncbi:MAG: DUF3943 domain-containing protein [Muribaculaceae bacterium]|nr:DUF3943 domain-containing protein [Muribaculaceae bacterium]